MKNIFIPQKTNSIKSITIGSIWKERYNRLNVQVINIVDDTISFFYFDNFGVKQYSTSMKTQQFRISFI